MGKDPTLREKSGDSSILEHAAKDFQMAALTHKRPSGDDHSPIG